MFIKWRQASKGTDYLLSMARTICVDLQITDGSFTATLEETLEVLMDKDAPVSDSPDSDNA